MTKHDPRYHAELPPPTLPRSYTIEELRVAVCVGFALTDEDTAEACGLSVPQVRRRVRILMERVGVERRAALRYELYEQHILRADWSACAFNSLEELFSGLVFGKVAA